MKFQKVTDCEGITQLFVSQPTFTDQLVGLQRRSVSQSSSFTSCASDDIENRRRSETVVGLDSSRGVRGESSTVIVTGGLCLLSTIAQSHTARKL